ncbi:hypothetical protein [Bdellovibrio sp. BCCA]|uniref:hypothetical protein n=1 Tax=Bdellovibrio sp. BCCA TaxID=3136281 RepID=UPI0030F1F58E
MKLFFVLATMLMAFTVHAADRKVGNVIAVEREITDLYNTCLGKVEDTTKPKSFFSCGIKYTTDGELPVSKGRVIKLIDDKCSVVGETMNGVLLITFSGAQNPSTFEASRACLEKAVMPKDSVKVVLYTLE